MSGAVVNAKSKQKFRDLHCWHMRDEMVVVFSWGTTRELVSNGSIKDIVQNMFRFARGLLRLLSGNRVSFAKAFGIKAHARRHTRTCTLEGRIQHGHGSTGEKKKWENNLKKFFVEKVNVNSFLSPRVST